ncbi:type IV pilin [Methanospirillum sp. J.3.6.1-F.2.7.3]|uniref:Type IV pilin n=1 Tax=Methanospirillum purgamenti TaxID=2834276 RepID=A0A8E7AY62_9EURY|nr:MULTISPECIES: type IV pilin N-terminal domain-containing protein [Methanospirillum]MDX8549811.1 type IV pilin N-terminal domain-containing protein [Methanospirillum hungatei]QVV89555.1 type IV pilin [Methanospirillum sp. J.3.6.1-F.2.7.3]
MRKDKALSEIVGALILVALVITGIGIIGVLLLSTPPPEAKEKVVLSSSCLQCNSSSFIIVTRHEGGDTIDPQKMKFYLSTEFFNRTIMERVIVYPTWFYPAEIFSSLDKTQICSPSYEDSKEFAFTRNTNIMKNGDVIVIWYQMKNNG